MLVALAISVLASQQATAPTVSFSCEPMPLKRLVPELSKTLRMPLFTAPDTESDVVMVVARDVTREELMSRIARAVNGTWQEESAGSRLIRTGTQEQVDRKAELDYDIAYIKRLLESRRKDHDPNSAFDTEVAKKLAREMETIRQTIEPERYNAQQWRRFAQLNRQIPAARLAGRLLSLVSAEELAALPKSIKVVYSTNPNRLQRQLGQAALKEIQRFVTEQAIWAEVEPKNEAGSFSYGGAVVYTYGFESGRQSSQISEPISKALVAITRQPNSSFFTFSVMLANSKGKVLARHDEVLTPTYDYERMLAPEKPGQGETLLNLPEHLKTAYSLQRQPGGAIPPALRSSILNPETHDPIAFMMGDLLAQAAEAKKMNLVACISDQAAFAGVAYGVLNQISVGRLLERLEMVEVKHSSADGWLMLTPAKPVTTRAVRVDRKDLNGFLTLFSQSATPTLDERAYWAAKLPPQEDNYLPHFLLSLVQPEQRFIDYSTEMLRLYGFLSVQQRGALSRGLPLSTFQGKQLECLNRMIFGPNSNLQINPPPERMSRMTPQDYELLYNGLMREPTEALPNGVPATAILQATVDESEAIFTGPVNFRTGYMSGRAMSPQEVAWEKFSQSRPDLFPYYGDESYRQINWDQVRYGARRHLQFQFKLTDSASIHHSLSDNRTEGNQMRYADLPEPFRKKVDDLIAGYVKNYENVKAGQQYVVPDRPKRNIPPLP